MNNYQAILGVFLFAAGAFAHSKVMERALAELSPEQLAKLVTGGKTTVRQLLIPTSPVLLALVLFPVFPNHHGYLVVPAIIIALGLSAMQWRAAEKKRKSLGMPSAYLSAQRKATVYLFLGITPGLTILFWPQLFH